MTKIDEISRGYPKLREVEVFPVRVGGQELICFRDPHKITKGLVVIPQSAYFIVSLFDGKHSIRDIQAEWMRKFGELIYSDQIVEIVEHLDSHFLLDNENFYEHRKKLEKEFLNSPVREPILIDEVYERDPEKLRLQIESYYFLAGGPGYGPRPQASVNNLRGLIVPHIDYQRGGTCYAWGYKELAESSKYEVFILLGTSHVPTQNFFVLTRKDFSSPFGIIHTDQEIINQLEDKLQTDFFADEFVHRNEHSLELQVVYLKYLFPDPSPIRIVPILCGSFFEIIYRGLYPREVPEINLFIEALGGILQKERRKICLIAGADLAHVGKQFGHPFSVSPSILAEIKQKDLEMLDYLVKVDAEGFYQYILQEKDQRNICGLPPIYAFLRLLEGAKGRLLNYQQWCDPAGNGAVTFASMAFC